MSFSFTNPDKGRRDDRTFSTTAQSDVEEKLDRINDMAHDILLLVAEVRRLLK